MLISLSARQASKYVQLHQRDSTHVLIVVCRLMTGSPCVSSATVTAHARSTGSRMTRSAAATTLLTSRPALPAALIVSTTSVIALYSVSYIYTLMLSHCCSEICYRPCTLVVQEEQSARCVCVCLDNNF